jgi:hypothetical protein
VAKQNFQKVNFCFPIFGGLQFQVRQDHFVSAGLGFIYDNESVVLTDRKNKSHNYSYTIQGIPLFLEYRLAIPVNLMTLSDGGLFSIALRWYWTLPGTEIYSSWGKIDADNSPFGAGFGLSVGYLIASWKGLNIFGDIGFSTIKVKSKETFADIVPGGPEEKAKWDIGGLQLQIRVSFGVWNKPKPIEKDEDDDIPDTDEASSDTPKAAAQDSSKAQVQDSSKTQAQAAQDSTQQAPAAQDSAQVTPQDSTVQDSAQASGVKKSDEKPAQASSQASSQAPAVKDSAKVEPAKAEKPADKKPDEKPAQAPAKKEPVSAKTPEE